MANMKASGTRVFINGKEVGTVREVKWTRIDGPPITYVYSRGAVRQIYEDGHPVLAPSRFAFEKKVSCQFTSGPAGNVMGSLAAIADAEDIMTLEPRGGVTAI